LLRGGPSSKLRGTTEGARADAVGAIGLPTAAGKPGPPGGAVASTVELGTLPVVSKRIFDLVVSTIVVMLAIPLMLAIAMLIKLDSPGPVFYRSRRIGRNSDPFEMLKFRAMVDGADGQRDDLRHLSDAPGGVFKIQNDPRLTRVGRLLRSTSLDELPQLFQVLTGTMSLVGPRPLPPEEDALVENAGRRTEARPGVTGPWQLAGSWRVPLHRMVNLDNEYLANRSTWLDVKMLARTVAYVLRRRGV
jgi:lipopolysaccharide/colanic/teichoic acid biosynthesis glycosyltransferase